VCFQGGGNLDEGCCLIGNQVDSLPREKPNGFSILESRIYFVFNLPKSDLAEDPGAV